MSRSLDHLFDDSSDAVPTSFPGSFISPPQNERGKKENKNLVLSIELINVLLLPRKI